MRAFRIALSSRTVKALEEKRTEADKKGDLNLFKKITAILALSEEIETSVIARLLEVSMESVRIWIRDFLLKGLRSLMVIKPKGRPSKLSKTQKEELGKLIENGPEKVGYPGQCWRSPMIQDLILTKFKVLYSVCYIAELLKNMGFSFQKAKFESGHLNEIKRQTWLLHTWPQILRKANEIGGYILFGDEASFPQWGTLNYTWARKGITPIVKTSGNRKAFKVFGLIEYFSGKFFCQSQETPLDSPSYIHFLETVLEKTKKHLFLIQDGSGYHTSGEMNRFFDDNSDRLTVTQLPAYSPDYNPMVNWPFAIKKQDFVQEMDVCGHGRHEVDHALGA
jgi:transposase